MKKKSALYLHTNIQLQGVKRVLIKILIGGLILFMVFNLFRAMVVMLKDDPNKPPMSKFIGRRVMASAVIILLILLAIATGLIQPNPTPY
ncbi:MAG: putative membrane-anchored protein [Paraglaciecola sp.]